MVKKIFYTFVIKNDVIIHLAGHCGSERVAQEYTPPFPLEHPGSCDFGKSQSHQSAAADPPAGEFEPLSEQLASPIHTNTQSYTTGVRKNHVFEQSLTKAAFTAIL